MRNHPTRRVVPDDATAAGYLEDALDREWALDVEHLGNRPDMTRAWELQNELRRAHGIGELDGAELESACARLVGTGV